MVLQPSRRTQLLLLLGLALHFTLLLSATAWYPGGTWWDPTTRGFRWAENFWCDLLQPLSHSGADNHTSAILARLSLANLGIWLAFFWPHFNAHFGATAWQKKVLLTCGGLGSLCLVLVALGTGRQPRLHDGAIVYLGPFGLLALLLGVWLTLKQGSFSLRVSGALAVLFALINMVQYAREALLGAPDWIGLPLIQKLSTASLLVWLVLTVVLEPRRP